MTERTGVVQEHNPQVLGDSWVLGANSREVLLSFPPDEVHAQDLHGARRGHELARVVNQQRHARALERAPNRLWSLVIVIAKAGKTTTRQCCQRSQRATQELGIAL